MKFLELMRGLKLIEDICRNSDIDLDGADVRLVSFQDGANGPIREKVVVSRSIAGGESSISFTPRDIRVEEDPKGDGEKPYFTPEQVRDMTPEQIAKNYAAITKSIKRWGPK